MGQDRQIRADGANIQLVFGAVTCHGHVRTRRCPRYVSRDVSAVARRAQARLAGSRFTAAALAQSAERLTRNEKVRSSILRGGSKCLYCSD